MARIAVMGLWHLGCIVSAGLARLGHRVVATDPDASVVTRLQQRALPIFEPGLAELMAEQVQAGRLSFCASPREALAGAEFVFITFDTPVDENDQSDLTLLDAAVETIAAGASGPLTVVVMSQVPVGTCQLLAERLRALAPQLRFKLLYQPENLRLGEALRTFLEPDAVVVGADDSAAAESVLRLYDGIKAPRLVMSRESAEMAKHALNAFLATSVSFVNEVAELAAAAGADVRDVVRVMRLDRRIGPQAFLNPGPGFSGGTLGRDLQTLRHLGERVGRTTAQLDATLAVNTARLPALASKLGQLCGGLRGARVGLLGLTYKPGTNTLRRSHALALARVLGREGSEVRAFDPEVMTAQAETDGIALFSDPYAMVDGADALVLATPWPEFKALDLALLARVMRRAALLDAHNFLDDQAARRAGFRYAGVGIPEDAQVQLRAK